MHACLRRMKHSSPYNPRKYTISSQEGNCMAHCCSRQSTPCSCNLFIFSPLFVLSFSSFFGSLSSIDLSEIEDLQDELAESLSQVQLTDEALSKPSKETSDHNSPRTFIQAHLDRVIFMKLASDWSCAPSNDIFIAFSCDLFLFALFFLYSCWYKSDRVFRGRIRADVERIRVRGKMSHLSAW